MSQKPMIHTCPRCGHAHPGTCGVDDDMLETLRRFARAEGRCWKSRLVDLWSRGADADKPLLRRLRNVIGPSGLYRLGRICEK